MGKMRIFLGKRFKKNKLYNLATFTYRLIFVNPRYVFRNIGFISKTKLDLMYKLKFKIKHIKTRDFKIYGDSALWVLYEKNGYDRIRGCKNVLDLGGYIGDSALTLSKFNNQVYVFEPDEKKYGFIVKNIKTNNLTSKIKPYKLAVVTSNEKQGKVYSRNDYDLDGGATTCPIDDENYSVTKCENINIEDVLKMEKFDGIKCDIEGGEWELFDYFMDKGFDFKKGVFELHFSNDRSKHAEKIRKLTLFSEFLKKKGYKLFFYILDPNKEIDLKETLKKIKESGHPETVMMYTKK